MITRPVSTAPHKARVSHGIRQLAREVSDTFPEMQLHGHLHDAARELDAGRTHSAQRHLNAAIFGLQPQQVRRHGIHDDGGHETAKKLMQQTYRHLLNVKDIEDMGAGNEELIQRRREAVAQQQAARQAQLVPAGGARQMSWEDVCGAIELATFAGKPPGSGANFAKLKGTLAGRGVRNPGALAAWIGRRKYGRKGFARLSAKGRSHSHANPAGGIELVGPKGYIHGWIKASMGALSDSGHTFKHGSGEMTRSEHRRAASAHLAAMKQAPEGSAKAQMHHKFAKLHAAAALGERPAYKGLRPATYGKNLRPVTYGKSLRPATLAGDQDAIELRGDAWRHQPRDTHGRWASIHANYHAGRTSRTGPRQDAEGKFRKIGYGAQHGNFGAAYTPGSLDHIRAIWDLGTEAGARAENRSPTMRNALHNMARAITRRDIRSARAHLREAKVANRREAGGFYTGDLRAIEDQLDRVPATVGNWMPQASPLSVGGQHLGRYVDRVGGQLPFNPTAGAYSHSRSRGRLTAARMAGTSEMSWSDIEHLIELSARTAMLERTPAPYGKPGGPGLYGVKGNKHSDYFEQVVKALMDKRGMDKAQASRIAWGALRKWRRGGGHVHPEVRAAAGRALTEEAAAGARAKGHATTYDPVQLLDFTGTAAGAAKDPRNVLGQFGSGGGAAAGPKGRKAQLQARAAADRKQALMLLREIKALQEGIRAARASAGGKISKGQKGAKTSATPVTKTSAPRTAATKKTPASAASGAATLARQVGTVKAAKVTNIKAALAQERQLRAKVSQLLAQAAQLSAQAAKL